MSKGRNVPMVIFREDWPKILAMTPAELRMMLEGFLKWATTGEVDMAKMPERVKEFLEIQIARGESEVAQ